MVGEDKAYKKALCCGNRRDELPMREYNYHLPCSETYLSSACLDISFIFGLYKLICKGRTMRKDTGIQLQRVDYGMIKIKKMAPRLRSHVRAIYFYGFF